MSPSSPPPPPSPAHSPEPQPRRATVRGVALGAVAVLGVLLTAAAGGQILFVTFRADPVSLAATECRPGVARLLGAVERARQRAATTVVGERTALAAFRHALLPEWNQATAIQDACKKAGDRAALGAYRKLELLRYAEEQAVRYEALDLSALRLRAPKAVRDLNPTAPTPP